MCTHGHDHGATQPPHPTEQVAKAMLDKANRFLATLHQPQKDLTPGREHALFPFTHQNREELGYLVPSARFCPGLPLGAMNPKQLQAARELLEVSLSEKGFDKVKEIQKLENVLAAAEKANPVFIRNPQAYFFSLFATPSQDLQIPDRGAWGWRYEGHHVSLHWTIVDGKVVSSTPQFLGAQPIQVKNLVVGGPPKGTRVLGEEEDLARDFIETCSHNEQQIGRAQVPWDTQSSYARYPWLYLRPPLLENRGISYGNLTQDQKRILRNLVEEHASAQHSVVKNERMGKIEEEGWGDVKFLWMWGFKRGDPLYYQVRGKSFLIEYNNKAFSNNNEGADHQHTVWRERRDWGGDGKGGYGPDLLRHHLENHSHHTHHGSQQSLRQKGHHLTQARVLSTAAERWDIGKLGPRAVWMPPGSSSRPYYFGRGA